MNRPDQGQYAGMYLQLTAYDCLGWSGLEGISDTLSMLTDGFRLMPLEHKEREVSGQMGRGLMGDRQFSDHLRDNIAKTREIFKKSPSKLGVTGKLFLNFRVGILRGTADFLPTREDATINLQATEFENGSNGLALSFSLAQPLESVNSSTKTITNAVMDMYRDICVELGSIAQPSYSWVDMDHRDSPPKPSTNDIRSMKLITMYWINYFGPSFLKRYGKDLFLDAPGWLKDERPEGAVLVQLGPRFASRVDAAEPGAVKVHFKTLGVTHVAWPNVFTDTLDG
jgi:hypothetical protein